MGKVKVIPAPYIDIYESVGGWKARLIAYDEEYDMMVPWQTGLWGYAHTEEGRIGAIRYAMQWAADEEIAYKGPALPNEEGTLVVCSCITGKKGCPYCGGTGKVKVKVIGNATTEE